MDILNLKIKDIVYNIATKWGKIKGDITEQTDLKNALNGKANTSDIPTDLSELSNATTKYVNETELQNAISALGSVFTLKGSVATVSNLPTTGNSIGDVYYVESKSAGYVWINDNGTERWELLGMTVDTSDFLTKTGLLQTTGNSTTNTMSQDAITYEINLKQDTLISGTNIKTINNNSLLGSGNINISSEETYSTTETRIGTWIDGKPIYRRIFTGTKTGARPVISNQVLNVDNVIKQYGQLSNNAWKYVLTTGNNGVGYKIEDSTFYIYSQDSTNTTWTYITIYEYTKTTDAVNS